MTLLDTNVVSEVMRDKPDPSVKDWLFRQPDDARHLSAGRTLPSPDGYIAAIAAAHGMTVATRDTAPFVAAGVPVVNPWQ